MEVSHELMSTVEVDTPPISLIDSRHDQPNISSFNPGTAPRRSATIEWPVFDTSDPFWIQFFNNCDRVVDDPSRLTPNSECIIWQGPRARYDLSKPMFRREPALTSRKNGCPQFHFKGQSYSARNVFYAAFKRDVHGETITKSGKAKRAYLRLASRCSNVSCVNPAHHYHRPKSAGIKKGGHYE